jgi:hypothetical protein
MNQRPTCAARAGMVAARALLRSLSIMKTDRSVALCLALLCLLVSEARAQTITVNVGASVGTGMEIGAVASTEVRRSPTFVVVNAGFLLDNDRRFELGAALIMELEGRVGIAVEPQLRIHAFTKLIRLYLVAGVPIFVAPYTLYGASLGPGASYHLKRFSVFVEGLLRAYPFGSDLPDGMALFHADLLAGARYAF